MADQADRDRRAYAMGCFAIGLELVILSGAVIRQNWTGAAILAVVLIVLFWSMRPLHRRLTLRERQ